jgi:AcrR family transcriptional regulator
MSARMSIEQGSIVEAALALIREGGWEAVSARKIASRLGASTMPIYSAIGSMEDLKSAAFERASQLLAEAQRKPRTGNEAVDLAVGYIAFSRDEPRLFRFIDANRGDIGGMLMRAATDPKAPGSIAEVAEVKKALASFAAPGSKEDLVINSWIFTNGLAALLGSGTLVMDDEEIARRLQDAGGAFYLYAHYKEERA